MPVKELGLHYQFASWHVPQFPRAIEYPLEVMEEIRAFACEELLKLSHGGDEVGGVLFGTRREDLIRILTWRPIACEHLDGPALRLSYNDRMNLAVQLEVARQNPDLKDLRPLGYFVSRPGGQVALTASDLEIYNGFFPEAWQIALVIRPKGDGRAEAGFFVREPDGKLQIETSHHSFALTPLHAAAVSPLHPGNEASNHLNAPPALGSTSAAATEPLRPASPEPPTTVAPQTVRVLKIEEASTSRPAEATAESARRRTPVAALNTADHAESSKASGAMNESRQKTFEVRSPERLVDAPSFEMEEQVPARERWLWVVPVLLAVGIAAFMLYQRRAPSPNAAIALQAASDGQNVQLTWNTGSRAVRDAYRGKIDIVDGNKSSQVALTADELHSGRLTYLPQSGDVDFAMTVYPPSGDVVHDSTRFIAPALNAPTQPSRAPVPQAAAPVPTAPIAAAPTPAPIPSADHDALEEQVQQLKSDLAKERARASELQNLVRILENRVGIQGSETPASRRP